jgi:predicted HNH restriction endonuclease
MVKQGTVTVDEVIDALKALGNEADSDEIKSRVISERGVDVLPKSYSTWESYRNTIDQLIHYHCPQCDKFKRKEVYFEQVSRGRYRLVDSEYDKTPRQVTVASEEEITLDKKEPLSSKSDIPIDGGNNFTEENGGLVFPEGQEIIKLHRERERNPKVIELVKSKRFKTDAWLRCDVCAFSFSEKFGAIGKGFIEAHHTIPISELTKESVTNEKDISLVCSNCHRILHRCKPWLSIEELRAILISRKNAK